LIILSICSWFEKVVIAYFMCWREGTADITIDFLERWLSNQLVQSRVQEFLVCRSLEYLWQKANSFCGHLIPSMLYGIYARKIPDFLISGIWLVYSSADAV
jgi:hypothetical protein